MRTGAQALVESLEKAGYTNLRTFPNGAELWDALTAGAVSTAAE